MTHEEILKEVAGIQYLYGLKHVIRYHLGREEEYDTESVAEHVFGMLILAEYFLPYEDPESQMDHHKIFKMMLYHDMDEIETGDTIGYLKTDAQRAKELDAQKIAITKIPALMQVRVHALAQEYDAQQTPEAKFAKAVDRLEPLFQLYNEEGKRLLEKNKTTEAQSRMLKDSYLAAYPMMKAFSEAMTLSMQEQGFWHVEKLEVVK